MARSKYSLLTLQKGLVALELIGDSAGDIGVTELAAQLDEPMTVAFRILKTLSDLGYVTQSPVTKRYRLGLRVWELSEKAIARIGIVEVAKPVLARCTQLTGETASLAVLQGHEFLYVASVDGVQPLNAYIPAGTRTPLTHPSASGRVFVAHSSPASIETILSGEIKRFTAATVTDRSKLRKILAGVRKNGFAVVHGEYQELLSAIAAPVFNAAGSCIAALAVSGVTQRFKAMPVSRVSDVVMGEAASLSKMLREQPANTNKMARR